MEDNLLEIINTKMCGLSKKQKKIAQTIVNDYDKAVFLTASGLGELAEVSESTVVRFAMELGFEGYPEFHRALEELVKRKLSAEQRMNATARKLDKVSADHILKKVMELDKSKIDRNLSEVDCDAFDEAVAQISSANRIYVIGGRSSFALTTFFSFYMGLMKNNVTLVNISSLSENFEQLIDINEKDVCVVCSFPKYYNRTIDTVKYISKNGTKIVAITDTKISPVAKFSNVVLSCQTQMMSLVDSLVPAMSIVNALLVAISLQEKDDVLNRFDRLEQLWEENDTYFKIDIE